MPGEDGESFKVAGKKIALLQQTIDGYIDIYSF